MDKARKSKADVHEISLESIARFCGMLKSAGRKESTVEMYRKKLESLRDFLPPDKCIDRERLNNWLASLREIYSSANSVNVCISVVNSYLDYVGRRELQLRRLNAQTQSGKRH